VQHESGKTMELISSFGNALKIGKSAKAKNKKIQWKNVFC